MKKALLLLCIVTTTVAKAQQLNESNKPILSVLGVGTVSEFPNAAEITIFLQHIKPTLREAINENQKTAKDVLNIVKQFESDSTKVKVSLISTDKATHWSEKLQKQIFDGYESSQRIVFTLTALETMQDFTEKLLTTKFNKIQSVNYFNTNGALYIKQAQEKAVADAMETTKRLAKAANLTTGSIIYLQNGVSPAKFKEYNSYAYNFETFNKSMGGRGVSSSGELINYTAQVEMQTEIK